MVDGYKHCQLHPFFPSVISAPLTASLVLSLLVSAGPPGLDGGDLLPAPEPFRPQVSDPLLEPAGRPPRQLASWGEARDLLRHQSLDERSAAAAVERAQGRWRQSLGALLPNARLSTALAADLLNPTVAPLVGVSPTVVGSRAPTVPVGTGTLSLSQSVVDVGAWKGLSSADALRTSAALNLEDARRRATQGLARNLVAVIAAERVAELNRVGLRQALERFALIGRTQELGAATQVDVVRTRQDVDVARGTLIAGDEQLRQTREALGVALGIDSEVGVVPGFALEALATEARAQCKSINWEQRADLASARANLESARESRRQASWGYAPTLGVTSTVFGYTTQTDFGRLATWNISAVLSVPLWEGGFREGLVTERAGVTAQAEASLEANRRQVRLEVTQALRRVSVAEALTATAREARADAAQLDLLTRRAFEVGRGSSLELVQSAAVLRQADVLLATREFELVQARLDVLMTEARCDW